MAFVTAACRLLSCPCEAGRRELSKAEGTSAEAANAASSPVVARTSHLLASLNGATTARPAWRLRSDGARGQTRGVDASEETNPGHSGKKLQISRT